MAFAGLSVALISLLAWLQPDFGTEELTLDEFWISKTFQPRTYDIVAFGDSRVYRGVSPEFLTQETGLSAFNLGYSSGGLSAPLFSLVEQTLSTSKNPIIIIGVSPHSLSPKGLENKQLKELLTREDAEQKRANLRETSLFRLFEPYRPSSILRTADSSRFEEYNTYYRNGWTASYSEVDDPERQLAAYRKNAENNLVSMEALEVVARKVEEWTDRGIDVIAFRVPTTKSMEALEDSVYRFDQRLVKQKFQQSGAFWLDLDSDNYRSYDGSHLHYQSAITLSKELGRVIKTNFRKD